MIRQDLKKPNYKQTRLVVRISNSKVTCQMIKAYHEGDKTLACANSNELRNYNIKFGLKNFSACYLTGLLIGCRVMRQSKLHKIYRGNVENPGVSYLETNLQGQVATYKAILDIGLKPSTKGSKLYAVLKGVADAGVHVPHSTKKFYSYDKAKKSHDTEKLKNRILGVQMAEYAAKSKAENKSHQFNLWPENKDIYPALIQQAMNLIRKQPNHHQPGAMKYSTKPVTVGKPKTLKKSYEQRKADIESQKQAWIAQIAA